MRRSDKFVLAGVFILSASFLYSCARDVQTHSQRFILNTPKDKVLPTEAKNKDGTPYTGYMYGTMCNESLLLDKIEWEGNFKDGRPVGEFVIYKEIGEGKDIFIFEGGEWRVRNPSQSNTQ